MKLIYEVSKHSVAGSWIAIENNFIKNILASAVNRIKMKKWNTYRTEIVIFEY